MSVFLNQAIQNKFQSDKYLIIIPVPDCLKTIDKLQIENIVSDDKVVTSPLFFMSLRTANIPNIAVPSKNISIYGQHVKMSSHARNEYEDLKLDFSVDNRFGNYYFMYKWLNALNDEELATFDEDEISEESYKLSPEGIKTLKAHKNYAVDCIICPLDEYGNPIIYFNFIGLFPTDLSGMKLDEQNPAEIGATATFSYSRFKVSFNNPIEGILISNQQPLRQETTTTSTSTTTSTTTSSTSTTTSKSVVDICQ